MLSQNRDINFEFAGFGVVGRVLAAGLDKGPAGVDIHLLRKVANRKYCRGWGKNMSYWGKTFDSLLRKNIIFGNRERSKKNLILGK